VDNQSILPLSSLTGTSSNSSLMPAHWIGVSHANKQDGVS
jgi:hypothetical protein